MSLIRQKHDPGFYSFEYKYEGYENIQEDWINIETGKSYVNVVNVVGAGVILGASTLIALAWWPILFASLLILIAWMVVPVLRPIGQKKSRYLYRNGSDFYGDPKMEGPVINWQLKKEPLYKEAINEWLEDVRLTNNIGTNKDAWTEYFERVQSIMSKEKASRATGPNFEKIKVLEELLKERK